MSGILVLRLRCFIPPLVDSISDLDCCCWKQREGSSYRAMSDARVAVSWRRCQNTYFTIQETLGARLHRLSGVKVPKATGVMWPTKFILTVPLLARLSGMDGARADT